MKKILLRAGMSPLIGYQPSEVIMKNMIGNNIGNMLFQTSVYRTLLCEDVVIDTINTSRKFTKWDIDQINANYECLVLPFANAFRASFMSELQEVTKLVNNLKIPCVVVGVGAQAGIGKDVNNAELDEVVKEFMKAVLKKSNIVGLRGEFTAEYLSGLGFQAERDYTVIGCPSLYMFGRELPKMHINELTPKSNVSINSKISLPQKFHDFLARSRKEIPHYNYVPQVIEEIARMYVGRSYPADFGKKIPKHFPVDFTNSVYRTGKGISFVNVPSWLDYLSKKDLSFGSRIHGNIASILAGTPCYIIVSDQRIMELVDYHHIPHMLMKDLNKDISIFDLYEKADFTAIHKDHDKRFMIYLDFLKKNNLQTIYNENGDAPDIIPFEEKKKLVTYPGEVKAFSTLTMEEQLIRLEEVFQEIKQRNAFLRRTTPDIERSVKDWIKENILRRQPRVKERNYPLIREYEREFMRRNPAEDE